MGLEPSATDGTGKSESIEGQTYMLAVSWDLLSKEEHVQRRVHCDF